MNYKNHHDRLIARAQSRTLTGRKERHHIVPRCMGGDNSPANLVDLTPEEHYVVHQLLVKMYPTNHGLAHAALKMAKQCTGNKAYGWLRRRHAIAMCGTQYCLGKKASAATRAKLSVIRKGHPVSAATRAKISIGHRGKIVSAETKLKLAAANTGKTTPAETRAKIAIAGKGNRNSLGVKASAETKALMSAQRIGNKYALGMRHSPETRAKMREQKLGTVRSRESIEKGVATRRAKRLAG